MEAPSSAGRLDNVLQMRLEQWHYAVLQFGKLFEIALAAEHVVSNGCQASCGCEPYVTGANY
jgi:hypothetical protein